MGESFAKKEKAKKKAKSKKDKALKMKERKTNNNKGKPLEDMMAYIDEDGNLSSTPQDIKKKKEISLEEIQLGAAPITEEIVASNTGTVSFFNEAKGYGFIIETQTGENIFMHSNHLMQPVKERDRVSFQKEKSEKGYNAVKIKKLNNNN